MFLARRVREGCLVVVLLVTASAADAQMLRGRTVAPNWAFGSPQPVFIRGCSDVDIAAIRCFGSFPVGPLSDVLRIRFLGRPVGTEAALKETAPRLRVLGRLYAGNEAQGDWWNLWIPTARWVGLGPNAGIAWWMRDAGDGNFFGDVIVYANINNAAHILWASNDSPDPSNVFPVDFLGTLGGLTLDEHFIDTPDGNFDQTNAPPPQSLDCTTDPACTPTGDFEDLATVPEPSTALLLGGGLAGLLAYVRRRRMT
jgi:hypothetical protein